MGRKDALINRNLIQQIVYNYNTTNVDEIRSILTQKEEEKKEEERRPIFSKRVIYLILQDIQEVNEEWIDAQAKSAYIQSVRKLLLDKKTRLATLTRLFNSDLTEPKMKSEFAARINETEDGMRQLMESLPLLMQFNAVMNGRNNINNQYELQPAVILKD